MNCSIEDTHSNYSSWFLQIACSQLHVWVNFSKIPDLFWKRYWQLMRHMWNLTIIFCSQNWIRLRTCKPETLLNFVPKLLMDLTEVHEFLSWMNGWTDRWTSWQKWQISLFQNKVLARKKENLPGLLKLFAINISNLKNNL